MGGFAAVGQHALARWAGVPDPLAWGATAVFELTMVAFLILGYLRGRDNLSPAPMWIVAGAVGAVSIFANIVHTKTVEEGLFYGMASVAVLLLWFAKLHYEYRAVLSVTGKTISPIPKYGRVWVLNPRRAWRAMLVATDLHTDDVGKTLRLAWTWQATYKASKLRGDRLAKLTAWDAVYAAWNEQNPKHKVARVQLPVVQNAQVTIVDAPVPKAEVPTSEVPALLVPGDPSGIHYGPNPAPVSPAPVGPWSRRGPVPPVPGPRGPQVPDGQDGTGPGPVPGPVRDRSPHSVEQLQEWAETHAERVAAVMTVRTDWALGGISGGQIVALKIPGLAKKQNANEVANVLRAMATGVLPRPAAISGGAQ